MVTIRSGGMSITLYAYHFCVLGAFKILFAILKDIKLGMVTHVCNPSHSGEECRRIMSSRPAQAKIAERPCVKNKIRTKGLGA
jgi:hypothetical protein